MRKVGIEEMNILMVQIVILKPTPTCFEKPNLGHGLKWSYLRPLRLIPWLRQRRFWTDRAQAGRFGGTLTIAQLGDLAN